MNLDFLDFTADFLTELRRAVLDGERNSVSGWPPAWPVLQALRSLSRSEQVQLLGRVSLALHTVEDGGKIYFRDGPPHDPWWCPAMTKRSMDAWRRTRDVSYLVDAARWLRQERWFQRPEAGAQARGLGSP